MYNRNFLSSPVLSVYCSIDKILRLTELTKAFLIAQLVKNATAMQETLVGFLDQKRPLEKALATQSSILGFPLWLSR